MEQLIELLKQIEELAGVAIEALEGGAPEGEGGPPADSEPGAPDPGAEADAPPPAPGS